MSRNKLSDDWEAETSQVLDFLNTQTDLPPSPAEIARHPPLDNVIQALVDDERQPSENKSTVRRAKRMVSEIDGIPTGKYGRAGTEAYYEKTLITKALFREYRVAFLGADNAELSHSELKQAYHATFRGLEDEQHVGERRIREQTGIESGEGIWLRYSRELFDINSSQYIDDQKSALEAVRDYQPHFLVVKGFGNKPLNEWSTEDISAHIYRCNLVANPGKDRKVMLAFIVGDTTFKNMPLYDRDSTHPQAIDQYQSTEDDIELLLLAIRTEAQREYTNLKIQTNE